MPYRLMLVLCLLSSVVHAQTAAPSRSMAPFKGWPIKEVVVKGVPDALRDRLAAGLATSGKSTLLGTERATLFPNLVEADISRIRLELARVGYPYAEVTPTYRGDSKGREAIVILTIDLSTPVVVDALVVTGIPDAFKEPADKWQRVAKGTPLRDADLSATAGGLQDLLRLNGYARATVKPTVTRLDHDRVRVTVAVTPGDAYVFSGVQVKGASDDLVGLITRLTDVEEGDAYSTDALKRARYQLQLLNLFSRIQLSTVDTAPGRLDLVVDITERAFRTTEAGVGYWTDDNLRVSARWQHNNLFNRGRGFRVNGFVSSRRRQGGIASWWPGIAGARILGQIRGSFERQIEDSYDLIDAGAEASLTYRHSVATTFGAGLALSWITVEEKSDDAVYEEDGGRILSGNLTWVRSTTDNPVDPTRGTDIGWRAESSMPGSVSQTHYVRFESGAKGFWSPTEGIVLGARVKGGVAWPTEDSVDLLPNVRFFAGGGSSMRGFRRRRLGPLDSDDDPIGGEALFETSAEVRFPVWWKLRGAAFIDAAQVWSDRDNAAFDALEYAYGPALMVSTPVGPIRTDLGIRLGSIDDSEPRTAIHLSIGHPF